MDCRSLVTYLLIISIGQISFISSAQTVWYVKTMGTGHGFSWATATPNLQEAIDSADTGDQIWIASGTYYPTAEFDADQSGGSNEREKTFYINKNIPLYGGFAGTETVLSQRSSANVVILSGDIDMVPEMPEDLENAYHVVFIDGTTNTIDSTCILDGLTIQDGFNGSEGGEIGYNGAGAYLNGSSGGICSPMFSNCNFIKNTAFFGDGIDKIAV